MTTTTLTIGELALHLRAADLLSEHFDTMVAQEFDVDVEYVAEGDAEVKAVKAAANVHFEGDSGSLTVLRGTDLLPLFAHRAVAELEDRINKLREAGNE